MPDINHIHDALQEATLAALDARDDPTPANRRAAEDAQSAALKAILHEVQRRSPCVSLCWDKGSQSATLEVSIDVADLRDALDRVSLPPVPVPVAELI